MFHVFPILMPWADASRRAYRAVGEFVAAHLPDTDTDTDTDDDANTGVEAGTPVRPAPAPAVPPSTEGEP